MNGMYVARYIKELFGIRRFVCRSSIYDEVGLQFQVMPMNIGIPRAK